MPSAVLDRGRAKALRVPTTSALSLGGLRKVGIAPPILPPPYTACNNGRSTTNSTHPGPVAEGDPHEATPAASNAFAPGSVTMVSAAMIERGRSEATIGGRGLELRLEGGCQLVAETPRPNSPLSHLLAALLTLTKSLDHDLKFSKSSSDVLTGRRYVV